jgi:uncharacterized protein
MIGAKGAAMHAFRVDGRDLLFDGGTMKILEVDEATSRVQQLCERGLAEPEIRRLLRESVEEAELNRIFDALLKLQHRSLRSADFREPAPSSTPPTAQPGSLCLQMSYGCNLRCRHCYAHAGRFGAATPLRMDRSTAERALEFFVEISGDRKRLYLDFSGGEPLLDFEVLVFATEKARELERERRKEIALRLFTNGLLLDSAAMDFLETRNFSEVNVSLDGPQEIHDRNRPRAEGGGSFEAVFSNLAAAMRRPLGKKLVVNACFDASQLDLSATVDFLLAHGLGRIHIGPYYLPWGAREEIGTVHEESLRRELLQIGRRLSRMPRAATVAVGPIDNLVDALASGKPSRHACAAGVETLSVSPQGVIYPCQLLGGRDAYALGTVFEKQGWKARRLRDSPPGECLSCWARAVCSDGCPGYSILFQGDVMKPHPANCLMNRLLTEVSVWIAAERWRQTEGGPQ